MQTRRPKTVTERVQRYDRLNPHIFALFRRFAHEVRASGMKRYSADAILHRVRWHVAVETKGEFKCNDHVTAFYARRLIAEDSTFDGFFALRKSAADKVR